jgi:parallel beta-helix repeat protein
MNKKIDCPRRTFYFKRFIVNLKKFLPQWLCIFLLCITELVSASSYYVSTSGNNNNPGTLSSPFRTINFAVSKLTAGDVLYVRSGVYNELVNISSSIKGTENYPISIKAYQDESPVIDGTGLDTGSGRPLVMIWSDYIHFIGFEVRNGNITGDLGNGGAGIISNGISTLISNCTVHDCWSGGIGVSGDYSIIEYCTVYNASLCNYQVKASLWGSGISQRNSPKYGIIRHCVVHDCWGEGISFFNASHGTVEDNVVYNCSSVHIYISDASYCLVQRNLVYRTSDWNYPGTGINFSDETFEIPQSNNICVNNIVYGTRRCFSCGDPRNTIIANNTFMNSCYVSCVQLNTESTSTNSYFINNIVIQEDNLYDIYNYAHTGDGSGITCSNNLFLSPANIKDYTGTNDIFGDPLIARLGNIEPGELTAEYFSLLDGSVAIDKGRTSSSVKDDFFGIPRDSKPDIGAIEFKEASPLKLVVSVSVTGAGGSTVISSNKGTLQLTASVTPSDATDKSVTWSIANGTGQATISSSGLVTAVANGTVTAKATANDGSGVYGTLAITISNQIKPVTGITVSGSGGVTTITTNKGTLQLIATIAPSDASNKTVTWSIANGTGQATISSSGLVTAVANGTVTARATANDGSGVSGTMIITISPSSVPVLVTGSIDNEAPSKVILTFSSNLANIIPASAAFAVNVNSNLRGVNSVSLSGNKVTLILADKVSSGDVITVSYSKPSSNPLQTTSGDLVQSFSGFNVKNNIIAPNSSPNVVVNFSPSTFSGFVSEINASGSYDADNDKLTFNWLIPENIQVSSASGPVIRYLGPVVAEKKQVQFVLNVTDGKSTISKIVPVTINPYEPHLDVAEVKDIKASSYSEPNYPSNIIDGNIGTMWAANGDNNWILFTLKEPFSVHHVKLAFQPGQARESYFDVLGSEDNITWEPILIKSNSCDFSGDLQVFDFPESKSVMEYKYIKLIGHGSKSDSWNYFSEIRIYGYTREKTRSYDLQAVKIFPNPAGRYVTIRIADLNLNPEFVRIVDLSGSILCEYRVANQEKELMLPLNLKNGLYILQLGGNGMTLNSQKLIVRN